MALVKVLQSRASFPLLALVVVASCRDYSGPDFTSASADDGHGGAHSVQTNSTGATVAAAGERSGGTAPFSGDDLPAIAGTSGQGQQGGTPVAASAGSGNVEHNGGMTSAAGASSQGQLGGASGSPGTAAGGSSPGGTSTSGPDPAGGFGAGGYATVAAGASGQWPLGGASGSAGASAGGAGPGDNTAVVAGASEQSNLGGTAGSGGENAVGSAGSGGKGNCTAEQAAKLDRAMRYLSNRVVDGHIDLAECFNASYLWEIGCFSGETIVNKLAALSIGQVNCAEGIDRIVIEKATDPQPHVLTADAAFVEASTVKSVAGAVAHAALHTLGYQHGSLIEDPHSINSVPEQGQACIESWRGNAPVESGYVMWNAGQVAAHDSEGTLAEAVAACQTASVAAGMPNKLAYECFFDGARIGYELFYHGEGCIYRAGFEPAWSRTAAVNNCVWNRNTYPTRIVECRLNGRRVGYELYINGTRQGREASYSLTDATNNCSVVQDRSPNDKMQCYFDGISIGYELFHDGERIALEPTFSQTQAQLDCQASVANNPSVIVECRYNGNFL